MVITFPAFVCLEATWRHIRARSVGLLSDPAETPAQFTGDELPTAPAGERRDDADVLAASALAAPSSSDEGTSQVETKAGGGPLTAAERRARAAALRALALSRARRFKAAEAAFTEAARLDPELDLTRTPGFWFLERGAHEAAIAAYVAATREGDAALLRAQVHSTYRPKLVRTVKGALLQS